MKQSLKDDLLEELTKLYIQSYEEDRKGHVGYIKRTKFLKGFINWVKEYL